MACKYVNAQVCFEYEMRAAMFWCGLMCHLRGALKMRSIIVEFGLWESEDEGWFRGFTFVSMTIYSLYAILDGGVAS